MPRVARAVSPARADNGVASSPSRTRRNLKRTASQAMPPTPPRTVKRGSKRRVRGKPASDSSKPKSPTRTRSRGSALETVLEESDEPEGEVSLRGSVGRRLDFRPAAKRRKLEELDARLETLLDSLDGEDAENPFWDGPPGAKASGPTDKVDKVDVKKGDEKANGSADKGKKKESSEKIVRVRSPSPPLLSFRGKAPVSPPPSNRRKRKVRGKAAPATETITEETAEAEGEPSAESSVKRPSEETGEPSTASPDKQSLESAEELLAKPVAGSHPSESTDEVQAKSTVEKIPGGTEEPPSKPDDELPVIDLPPMPSTPKKGKKRMDSPIRDSPNNPFLEDSPASVTGESAEPRTPTTLTEKPTITYVFRGVRAEFANPMYNLPSEVHEHSLLPVEHPDFSPDPACPPKLLFNGSRRRRASPSPTRKGRSERKLRSNSAAAPAAGPANGWDDSDDEADLHVTPPRRLFH